MNDIRDDAAAAFAELFGRAPDGLWSAPGRVNLIGDHTDYNEGFALPIAIDRRTVAAVGLREDTMLRVASGAADELVEIDLADLSQESLAGWPSYPLGVVLALKEFGADLAAVPGVDLFIESDVPVGAGLSSSAAIECAVAIALNELWHVGLDLPALAAAGQLAEQIATGTRSGMVDQSASLRGQDGSAIFLDCRSLEAEAISLGLDEAQLSIVVIDTATESDPATDKLEERRASCERAAAALGVSSLREVTIETLIASRDLLDDVTFRRARHVVTENKRVLDTVQLVREFGPHGMGAILDASHASMRDDFEISTPELNLAVETANAHGALGARMTGGGFGGAAIALVPAGAESLLRVAIDGAFAEHAYDQPDIFVVTASRGAQRDR